MTEREGGMREREWVIEVEREGEWVTERERDERERLGECVSD